MKQYSLLTTFLFTLIFNISFGQVSGRINGEINDGKNKPVASVTVSLLRSKDSSLVKTTTSDRDGKYGFAYIAPNSYIISASAIGFTKTFGASFSTSEKEAVTTVPAIQLKEDSKILGAVTVTAQKPMIEIKADKTVLNVAGSINAVGSTAMELLEKIAGSKGR